MIVGLSIFIYYNAERKEPELLAEIILTNWDVPEYHFQVYSNNQMIVTKIPYHEPQTSDTVRLSNNVTKKIIKITQEALEVEETYFATGILSAFIAMGENNKTYSPPYIKGGPSEELFSILLEYSPIEVVDSKGDRIFQI